MDDHREFLTIAEVAARIGTSEWTAARLAREGRLPVIRRGRRVVVPTRAFERWLEAQAAEALAAAR